MKDAKAYEKKIKQILSKNRPAGKPRKVGDSEDAFTAIVEGVMAADTNAASTKKAMAIR